MSNNERKDDKNILHVWGVIIIHLYSVFNLTREQT